MMRSSIGLSALWVTSRLTEDFSYGQKWAVNMLGLIGDGAFDDIFGRQA
jgi:hypothetical protein